MESTSTIPEWFRDRNILVTGATGFMGKVLLTKLLTSCPNVANIYLLVREKKGTDPKTRLNAIIQQEPFKALRENSPEILKKLVVIPGDTTTDGLGLSTANTELLINEVSVVFHMAANVRFDLTLKTAVTLNTLGTSNVVTLVKQMKNVRAFIHVSTAYCQHEVDVLEERAYPTNVKPETILSLMKTESDEEWEKIAPGLLGLAPNTYSFTKALSEDLVSRCGLPVGIARPSIVVASIKEPVPGWVDNMNGPTGLMVGAGKGVIRTMLCNEDYLTNLIPCDYAINAIIALAWKVGMENPIKPIFLNVAASGENPLTWKEGLETGKKHIIAHPFSVPLWYPGGGITSNKLYHNIRVLLLHLLPAYLLDALLLLLGKKPFLVRVQAKVSVGQNMLYYYTTKNWIFRTEGMMNLEKQLSPRDKEIFVMDTKNYTWDDYLRIYIQGTRKFCLKEDPASLPRAKKVMGYLYVADMIVKILFFGLLAWFGYSWFSRMRIPTKNLIEINEF